MMKHKIEKIYNAIAEQRDFLKEDAYDDPMLKCAVYELENVLNLLLHWDD